MKRLSHRRAAKETLGHAVASPMGMPADVTAAARAICEEHAGGVRMGGGIPEVAARIGVSAAVLYNKLSGAEDGHHKLTVRDVVLIWLATRRIDHLQALARTMNCVAIPVPDFGGVSDTALLELICRTNKEGGEFHRALGEALDDGEVCAEDLAKLEAECADWIGAIVEMRARLRAVAGG